jgi:uncharacterized protein involved in exopolysaccharide biosynthesis
MAAPSFDLIDIIRTLQKKFGLIVAVTVAAALLGLAVFSVRPKKYKGVSKFLVNNPLYGDRNTLFRSYETRYVDYFGGDDDLDKVTSLATSDTVVDRVIRNCQFQDVYKSDINDVRGHAALMGIFKKNFNLKRSEYKDIEISYIAYDPVVAANVANMTVKVLEETYRHFYTAAKQGMINSINERLSHADSAIAVLTDSLASLRDRYGIYSIISPGRQGQVELHGGGKGYGRAVEEIQNVESVKDQLVADRAHYVSLVNEFTAAQNGSIQYLKVITRALPPTGPDGPGLFMTMLVAGGCGLFFSAIFFLLMAYYQLLNEQDK